MKKKTFPPLLFAVGLLVLAGCTADAPSGSEAPAPAEAVVLGGVRLLGSPEGLELSREQGAARLRAAAVVDWAIQQAVEDAPDWQAADQAVRALLVNPLPPPPEELQAAFPDPLPEVVEAYVLEQLVATTMLTRYGLLDGTPSSEQQAAIAFYTDLLVRHNSPDAPLIAAALRQLDGALPVSELAYMAAQTSKHATARLAKEIGCADADCMSDFIAKRPELGEKTGRQLDVTQQAIAQLDALAVQ